jgi:plastocyanin
MRLVAASALVLFVVLGGPAAKAADRAVTIEDPTRFNPTSITVAAGDIVVWTSHSVASHTVTADDGAFDSNPACPANSGSCMKLNDTFRQLFDRPGTYRYYCKIHGGKNGSGMSGTVVVTDAPATTVATTSTTTTAVPRTTTTVKATTTTASTSTTSTSTTTSSTTSTTSTTVAATTTTTTPSGNGGGGNGALAALLAALIVAVAVGGGFALYQMRPDGPGFGPWRRPPRPF